MRGYSLCSGIGGLDLAAELAGIDVVAQVEFDPYCRSVLRRHWPDTLQLIDMKEVTGDEAGHIDILFGGIPCQPFSVAGKKKGFADERHLWPYMLDIVRRVRPTWVLVENVAGFTSIALDLVADELEAENYQTGAFLFPAAAFGAPHRRDRTFLVAHTHGGGRQACQRAVEHRTYQPDLTDAGRGDNTDELANAGRAGPSGCGCGGVACRPMPAGAGVLPGAERQGGGNLEPWMGRAVNGLAGRLDNARWPAPFGLPQYAWEEPRITTVPRLPKRTNRVKALGNAVVWRQAYPVFAYIAAINREAQG